jgi:hypothetical protein
MLVPSDDSSIDKDRLNSTLFRTGAVGVAAVAGAVSEGMGIDMSGSGKRISRC